MATSTRIDEIPALDGFRALACLLVVMSHIPEYLQSHSDMFTMGLPFGQIGVAVFFGLSGFLMAHLYAERAFSLPVMMSYLIARFSRIVPAYWLTILLCFGVYRFIDPAFVFQIDGANLLRHLLFLGSVGVFWSIPPEIQYYLFFVLLWCGWQQWCGGQRLWLIVLLLAAAVLMLSRAHWPGILLPSKLHFFLAGSTAALLFHYWQRRWAPSRRVVVVAQCFTLLLAIGIYRLAGIDEVFFYQWSLFFLLVAMMLLAFGFRSRFADRLFGNPPLRWLGRVSFSVYLLHCPVIYLCDLLLKQRGPMGYAGDLLVLLLAVLLPALFSQWVELPLCRGCKNLAHKVMASVLSARLRRRANAS